MHLPTIATFVLFYFTSCAVPVTTMRQVPPPGWEFPWPGLFQDERLRFHDNAVVYAWPSTGGRLELQNPSVFELDILGIQDHSTEHSKSTNPIDEDAFAVRLRRLGGTFYKY